MTDKKEKLNICLCYKQFNSRQALYQHKKKCPVIQEEDEDYEDLYKYYKKMCLDLVEKNTILQQHNRANKEQLKAITMDNNHLKKTIQELKSIV